ncbi:CCN family member 3-like isoform X2 [Hemiscyllium ocellatum]|uniref:CCN family member 3-like isoform X2 n=1 Tax=Hemiscyllium ocellatum TaxID=170820 RepID=UPI002966BB77|nr:CCN family member 3-like isoform X2 [Hemiscyllium ocellatum]
MSCALRLRLVPSSAPTPATVPRLYPSVPQESLLLWMLVVAAGFVPSSWENIAQGWTCVILISICSVIRASASLGPEGYVPPSCKYHCWCSDGGIGCIPRCSEDVRLQGPDCLYPKRVEIPGECCPRWICEKQDNGIFGNALAAYRSEVLYGRYVSNVPYNCPEQSSEWSACSRSCGIGVSTRISNKNDHCVLETQSQLCIVRPCQHDYANEAHMRRKICRPTTRASHPIQFEYNNCISVKAYRPRYCGLCSDRRCCTPHKTRTELLDFRCNHGRIVKQQMMFIISCVCHYNCSHAYN